MSPSLTELELERRCGRSFLRLWSHARPYFAKNEELCDLLAVFGDDVFIFSDKARQIPEAEAADPCAWQRWQRKAINESIDAVFKAERRLKRSNRVFTDASAAVELPVRIPTYDKARIHRIAVAHGAASACRALRGGSGSLTLSTYPHGADTPYIVHGLNTPNGLVHVLDEVSLPIVLQALDTMPEFRDYLVFKEELVATGTDLSYIGEEDLLGLYLQRPHHADPRRHGLGALDGASHVVLAGPAWSTLSESPEWRERRDANRVSYYWDDLIERFTSHVLSKRTGTAPHDSLDAVEAALRICAAEPRTTRRTLGRTLHSLATHPPMDLLVNRLQVQPTGTVYTFVVMDGPTHVNPTEVDELRGAYLCMQMYKTREMIPASAHIGYAFTSVHASKHSEILMQIGCEPLNEESRRELEAILARYPASVSRAGRFTEKEYPSAP